MRMRIERQESSGPSFSIKYLATIPYEESSLGFGIEEDMSTFTWQTNSVIDHRITGQYHAKETFSNIYPLL